MQQALGLMGDQALMFGVTVALGVGGIAALLLALFWPRRWRLRYRVEVIFVLLLAALAVYADFNSAATYQAYEAVLPDEGEVSGRVAGEAAGSFDRDIRVFAYQWGFVFLDENDAASRNAVKVAPGDKVLFRIMANDVIHGFNVPVARMTTEFEPGETRAIWIRAPETPGKYLIQCVNYCGLGHAQMKAWLVVAGDGDGEAADDDHARG